MRNTQNQDVNYTLFYEVDKNGVTIGRQQVYNPRDMLKKLLLIENIVGLPSGALMKRYVFETIGGFDTDLSTAADWDFWIRAAKYYEFKLIEEPLFKYRIHDTNMHKDIKAQENDTNKILKSFFSDKSVHVKYCKFRKEAFSNAYMLIAKSYLRKREYAKFLKNFLMNTYFFPCNLFKSLLHYVRKKK